MVKAAAAAGLLDERAAVLETLTAIRRAGADIVITYHAKDAARWLHVDRRPQGPQPQGRRRGPARRDRQAAAQPDAGQLPARPAPVRGRRGRSPGSPRTRCSRASSTCSTTGSSARSRRSSTRARSATARCSSRRRSTPSTRSAPRSSSTRTPASATTTCATTTSTCGSRSRSRSDSKLGLQGTLDVIAGAHRRRVDPPAADAQALQDPHGPRDGGRHRRAQPAGEAAEPLELEPIELTDEDIATVRATQGPMPVVAGALRARRRAPRRSGRTAARAPRLAEGARRPAPRRRDPLPPPRRLLRQRHGRLGGPRRPRSSRSASGWPRSAASRTATSARPTPTGRTPSSRWPTAAPRRSATRSSTRSPTATGIEERATLYSSTEFKKVRLLYFTDAFKRWERGARGR